MLEFNVSLWVTHHANGSYTLSVVGTDDLTAWGLDVDELRGDLEIALSDRLERMHPSLLHRFHAPRGREWVRIDVPDGFRLYGEHEPIARDLPVDVLMEPEGGHVRLRLPDHQSSLWLSAEDDLGDAVVSLMERTLDGATHARRLAAMPPGQRTLETLTLRVEPAGLASFTGEHAGSMLLPEPKPKPTEREKAEEKRFPTPVLDEIGMEMGPDAGLVGAYGRDKEVADLRRMLQTPNAVVVVGPSMCGKTAVIEQVAKELGDQKGWFVNASRLVNAPFMKGWRGQTLDVVTEIGGSEGVWFVGDPLELLDAGKHVGSDMNIAQLLKNYLSSGTIRVLAECSVEAWGRLEALDMGFARLFTPYRLEEPEDGASILAALSADLPVPVIPDAVAASMELALRYGPAQARMGTAAHFLRRMAAEARARGQTEPLTRVDVWRRFCSESGMPELLVRDDLRLDPEALRKRFRTVLVGQDDAVDLLTDLIAVVKGGMSDLDRPLGAFLFIGPTGVGKTEAAKALARWMFGGGRLDGPARLVRFDMSEFSGPDCLQRLLHPSSGLPAAVRRRPFSVVLLDEIEKAHSVVFDLLLQVLGEARLSDSSGNIADFRNCVILLTSNLGVESFRRPTGFGGDVGAALQSHIQTEVERFFRPEFVNRLDRVVPFQSLGASAIRLIADREVDQVCQRSGLVSRGIQLTVDPAAVAHLSHLGVDPAFGARPLKRAVQSHLIAPLARHLAGTKGLAGVDVSEDDGVLTFTNRTADKVATHERLRKLMTQLADQRYVADCWLDTDLARTASREVELVDRLMGGKRFWADHSAAEARSRAIEPVRAAVVCVRAAREEVLAVEDLVHEAWTHQDETQLDELLQAASSAVDTLDQATVQLAGCRLEKPDVVTLILHRAEGDGDPVNFRRDLVRVYSELALAHDWTISAGKHTLPTTLTNVDRFVKSAMGKTSIELRIQGPHAHTLLRDEAGVHTLKHPSTPVKILVDVKADGKASVRSGSSRTVYDPGRRHLVDAPSKLTATLVSKWHIPLDKLLILRLHRRVLGAERGRLLWKATRV